MTAAILAYERVARKLEAGDCVLLDGGTATELAEVGGSGARLDDRLWGTRALVDAPDAVLEVHRRYAAAGCDVVTTNTWGLAAALAGEPTTDSQPIHWLDVARRALRLARQAVESVDEPRAVAFSLNEEVESPDGRETLRLLARLFRDEPGAPDILLIETLSVVSDSLFDTVEVALAMGLPVWLSFRRCRHGLCGVFGQHWGGPEGDAFGRAARRFEEMGVAALLVNCIPPDHVDGMVSYVRDFTDMPLGVYPNLGYFTERGWRFDPGVDGAEYAARALRWRAEGAQIVGGCCGVRPEHISAVSDALTVPVLAPAGIGAAAPVIHDGALAGATTPPPPRWANRRERDLYPLAFPDLVVDPGVQAPAEPSFMVWRHLFDNGVGAHQRCLDLGCGTGLLGIQLALNGATHVHAFDIDRHAVANTLANAFRNDVDARVSAAELDIYPWVPKERYEIIVASIEQLPLDPAAARGSHRVVDYWGRHLVDQVIAKLPDALAPEGVAYLMQLSIVSQRRTAALLEAAGFSAEVVDYSLFGFLPEHQRGREQIARVEAESDGYHLAVGGREVMVAYLLEVKRDASHTVEIGPDAK